jgi:NADH:ubiquinone oxidoreductase subunit D
MMKENWIPSMSAYCVLVKGLCKMGEINTSISLVKDCLGNIENGPAEFKYTLTILEACRSKSLEKVINVVYEMIEVGCSMEEIVYFAIIYGFCKYASSTEARQVFTIMRDQNNN